MAAGTFAPAILRQRTDAFLHFVATQKTPSKFLMRITNRVGLSWKNEMSNEPVDLIPVPSGLLAYLLLIPLRGQEECQKQAGIGHWGRSTIK